MGGVRIKLIIKATLELTRSRVSNKLAPEKRETICLGKDPARLSGCESNPEPIAIHEFIRMRIHIPQAIAISSAIPE